jgi:hypothetical protein
MFMLGRWAAREFDKRERARIEKWKEGTGASSRNEELEAKRVEAAADRERLAGAERERIETIAREVLMQESAALKKRKNNRDELRAKRRDKRRRTADGGQGCTLNEARIENGINLLAPEAEYNVQLLGVA